MLWFGIKFTNLGSGRKDRNYEGSQSWQGHKKMKVRSESCGLSICEKFLIFIWGEIVN